jgi:type VI secretion system secreted protein Hcp
MATDTFLWFEEPGVGAVPIEGETTDNEFKGKKALEIETYDFAFSNPVDVGSASGGSGAGRVDFGPLSVNVKMDTSFISLLKNACSGGHWGKVTLVRRRSGADKTKVGAEFFKIEMKLAMITGVSFGVGSGSGPHVALKIDYGAIQNNYTPQNADGSLGAKVEKKWSSIKNDATFAV